MERGEKGNVKRERRPILEIGIRSAKFKFDSTKPI